MTILAERLLAPVRAADVDTLLLGCTHYPYLARVISDVMGPEVVLVSSADETAFALRGELERRQLLRAPDADRPAVHRFLSSGDVAWFADLGRRLLGPELARRPGSRRNADSTTHRDPTRRPMTMTRPDGRAPDELRPISFERDFTTWPAGRCSSPSARTRVLCTASRRRRRAPLDEGQGPGLGHRRVLDAPRLVARAGRPGGGRGKQGGRTMEIQRLIGRALRASCDLVLLGERQVVVDCDVLQADGGTRTASICGGYLALHDALARLVQDGQLRAAPAALAVRGHQRRHRRTRCPCSTSPTSRTPRPRST